MEYPNGIDIAAWKYLAVVVPIIVFFAPLGSLLSSYFHRQVLAALVYVLDTVALVSSFHKGILVGSDSRKNLSMGLLVSIFFEWKAFYHA